MWPFASSAGPNAQSQVAELYRRDQEQRRLFSEQSMALQDMTEWQRRQQDQMSQLAEQRYQEQLGKLQEQAELVQKQKLELERLGDLRRRALELDSNNRDLHAQLAQSQQENRLMNDQLQLLRQQLSDTANQLAAALQSQQDAEGRVSELQASMQRRGSATITANSSMRRSLSAVTIAGLVVRQDGDVVRMELPSDRIFAPGTATLTSEALALIDQVAGAVKQNYSLQMIGIEAHTDNGPLPTPAWQSHHQLAAAQATAVFEQFRQRHNFPPQQLFVLGHGANYPVASNATPTGQQRNRRVEIVVYPETMGERK
jgi:flagellar motor protein MotB